MHTDDALQPIVLLADSQLLFWRPAGRPFLSSILGRLPASRPKAAYLGASNGDRPEFFELFCGAMASSGVEDCRQIPGRPSSADRSFFDSAELILLAGGDPRQGWRVFQDNGLATRLVERFREGALLVGISAGAMQLGLFGSSEDGETTFKTLGLVPYVVDAHDEPRWQRLRTLLGVVAKEEAAEGGDPPRGLGIPSGGGAFFHPRGGLEPIRYPLTEIGP